MKSNFLFKGISCLLTASLLIHPFHVSPIQAAENFTLDLDQTLVSIHVDGNDIVNYETNTFSLYRSDGAEVARWNYGDEDTGRVASGNGHNISKDSDTLIRYKLNHASAVNDSQLRDIKQVSLYTTTPDGQTSSMFINYDGSSPSTSFWYDSANSYQAEYQFFGKNPTSKYTIPAGQVYLANFAGRNNYDKVKFNKADYKITGTKDAPNKYALAEGTYETSIGTYGSGDAGFNGCYDLHSYDHATNYHKVTISLSALYPQYFATDGSLYTDISTKINGATTVPYGYSSYTINGQTVLVESAICIISGAFIQVPELDSKGNATFYVESDSRTAEIATYFTLVKSGARSYGDSEHFTYVDYDSKVVTLLPQAIDLGTDFVIQGLPTGTYTMKQTAADSLHTIAGPITFNVGLTGKVQKVNYVMKDRLFSLDTPSEAPPSSTTTTTTTTTTTVTTVTTTNEEGKIITQTISEPKTTTSTSTSSPESTSTYKDPDMEIWNMEECLLFDSNIDKREKELSPYSKLQLKLNCSLRSGKAVNTISWKKVSGADGYIIYGGKCGGPLERLATVASNKTHWSRKDLSKGSYYRYVVAAYKGGYIIATSKTVHGVAGSSTAGNPAKITGLKKNITMKVGSSKTLKAKVVAEKKHKIKKHVAGLRYESSNSKIVSVSKSGKLKAKTKGSATIYVYAQNGISKKIKVKVK